MIFNYALKEFLVTLFGVVTVIALEINAIVILYIIIKMIGDNNDANKM